MNEEAGYGIGIQTPGERRIRPFPQGGQPRTRPDRATVKGFGVRGKVVVIRRIDGVVAGQSRACPTIVGMAGIRHSIPPSID